MTVPSTSAGAKIVTTLILVKCILMCGLTSGQENAAPTNCL
jgi:hypothetical protein